MSVSNRVPKIGAGGVVPQMRNRPRLLNDSLLQSVTGSPGKPSPHGTPPSTFAEDVPGPDADASSSTDVPTYLVVDAQRGNKGSTSAPQQDRSASSAESRRRTSVSKGTGKSEILDIERVGVAESFESNVDVQDLSDSRDRRGGQVKKLDRAQGEFLVVAELLANQKLPSRLIAQVKDGMLNSIKNNQDTESSTSSGAGPSKPPKAKAKSVRSKVLKSSDSLESLNEGKTAPRKGTTLSSRTPATRPSQQPKAKTRSAKQKAAPSKPSPPASEIAQSSNPPPTEDSPAIQDSRPELIDGVRVVRPRFVNRTESLFKAAREAVELSGVADSEAFPHHIFESSRKIAPVTVINTIPPAAEISEDVEVPSANESSLEDVLAVAMALLPSEAQPKESLDPRLAPRLPTDSPLNFTDSTSLSLLDRDDVPPPSPAADVPDGGSRVVLESTPRGSCLVKVLQKSPSAPRIITGSRRPPDHPVESRSQSPPMAQMEFQPRSYSPPQGMRQASGTWSPLTSTRFPSPLASGRMSPMTSGRLIAYNYGPVVAATGRGRVWPAPAEQKTGHTVEDIRLRQNSPSTREPPNVRSREVSPPADPLPSPSYRAVGGVVRPFPIVTGSPPPEVSRSPIVPAPPITIQIGTNSRKPSPAASASYGNATVRPPSPPFPSSFNFWPTDSTSGPSFRTPSPPSAGNAQTRPASSPVHGSSSTTRSPPAPAPLDASTSNIRSPSPPAPLGSPKSMPTTYPSAAMFTQAVAPQGPLVSPIIGHQERWRPLSAERTAITSSMLDPLGTSTRGIATEVAPLSMPSQYSLQHSSTATLVSSGQHTPMPNCRFMKPVIERRTVEVEVPEVIVRKKKMRYDIEEICGWEPG
eukprot:gnl/MRDRNA2_/MRDRNA2_114646_c0_seq1.p1 gnl/MRDRNA2_/MRDRNA2_114646_c0~~gnl/MRDRNA2_/MRDRNA2_114646_c0_seq1.p1  ORF type:complete len:880 (+),score=130.11 gnl/MRDRNA2_/MRDRNA2_114646_c0_seq1:44-2641(+)